MALGEALVDFTLKAEALSRMALSASTLLKADQIGDTVVALREILDEVGVQASTGQGDLEGHICTIELMVQQTDHIFAVLGNFGRILKTMKMLGISTRIESSRFTDVRSSFESLADEVERSASKIQSKQKEMGDHISMLSTALREVMKETKTAATTRHAATASILGSLLSALTRLEQKQITAAAAVESIFLQSEEIVRNINQVIVSLQFHDICRQQLEHVVQSLQDLCPSISSKSEGSASYHICALQLAQMTNTQRTIYDALEQIRTSMEEVADRVGGMGLEVETMVSSGNSENDTYLLQLEQGAQQILALFDGLKRSGNHLDEAIRSTTGIASSARESVAVVQDIVDDIGLLSLNARIKAARAGQAGCTVGVLSQAIERLSGEMRTASSAFSQSFDLLLQGASDLEQSLEGAGDKRTERLLTGLDAIRSESAEGNREAVDLLSRIRAEGARLSASIRSTTTGITVHKSIARHMEGFASVLKEVLHTLRVQSEGCPADDPQDLLGIRERYTMESERQIHRAQFAQLPDAPPNGSGSFGDNVELF